MIYYVKKKKNPLEIIFVFGKKNLKSHVFSLTEKKKKNWKKKLKKISTSSKVTNIEQKLV